MRTINSIVEDENEYYMITPERAVRLKLIRLVRHYSQDNFADFINKLDRRSNLSGKKISLLENGKRNKYFILKNSLKSFCAHDIGMLAYILDGLATETKIALWDKQASDFYQQMYSPGNRTKGCSVNINPRNYHAMLKLRSKQIDYFSGRADELRLLKNDLQQQIEELIKERNKLVTKK